MVPREQIVHALNVRSDKLRVTNVDSVHYEKNLGVAEITQEAAKDFCKRYHPDRFAEFCRTSLSADYPVYNDFEDQLTHLERLPPYTVLLDVIRRQVLTTMDEKAFIAAFVYLQVLRSHAIMSSMIEWNQMLGRGKFEHFVLLRWLLTDAPSLYQVVAPLALSRWTLYRTGEDAFPLCDSPVLVRPGNTMIALSPRLMLEIAVGTPPAKQEWQMEDGISDAKLADFRRRTIGNTFREIIFSNRSLLEEWQGTQEFRNRVTVVHEMKGYNARVAKLRSGEIWQLNACGNK
jgi:hypothetical protein